ncbi:type 4a pilus biogenesis protein PilO [Candidatus Roizmanbacteria bacterium]|nr:MAG: type 4a pilus biogenesis protein PilO [Candidatus Roizmanbacteria bacterium]
MTPVTQTHHRFFEGLKNSGLHLYHYVLYNIFDLRIFAIRPALSTAISLNKQEADLKTLDGKYELLIGQIVQIQNALQLVRDKLYLIDEALPAQPYMNIMMSDIQESAKKNNISIRKIDIHRINLVETEKNLFRSMVVNVELGSTFDDFIKFEKDLLLQRRLKKFKTINIGREDVASGSATLNIKAEIEGYYL